MARVSNSDLRKVLSSINVLNSAVDLATLRKRTLACMESLIPNSTMTAFDGLDPEGEYDGSLWYSPPGIVSPADIGILVEFINEHPYCQEFYATESESIFRLSDKISLSNFHRTTLFNEFYRRFQGEAQIASVFRLSATSLVSCTLHRPKTDFTDREKEMLRLVTPHLRAAFVNAKYVEQVDRQCEYLDKVVSKGLILLDENGNVVFVSRLAQEWLPKYFPGTCSGGLPSELALFVQQATANADQLDYSRPAKSLSVFVARGQLNVSVAVNSMLREVVVLLEEVRHHEIEDFKKMDVTTREAEILYWISRGKTDPEIAVVLSISPRTVQKHLEHIFTKLGVETRTAAVMQLLSIR